MFNTQVICMACKEKEQQRADYRKAVEADHAEIRKGNYNFQGIGLDNWTQTRGRQRPHKRKANTMAKTDIAVKLVGEDGNAFNGKFFVMESFLVIMSILSHK